MANRINIVISAKDEGSAAVKTFGRTLDDVAGRASGFGASLSRIRDVALGVYLPQLAGKFFDLGRAALQGTAEFEQSRIAFDTMLGSGEKAAKLMQEIADFAKATPFELPEVVAGTKQLLAFGFAQDQLIPTMRKLGDLASGLGVPVGQLTNVYGQVRVAGRLMGQDLLQFTNAGVPMIEALSKTMGVAQSDVKKMVEEGKIGFPEVEAALNSLTGEGSKFGGMMDKQSKTFNGVMSNISDTFGKIGRSAMGMDDAGNIIKGGFFDRIKGAAEAMLPALLDFSTRVGPGVQVAMDWLIDKGTKLWNVLTDIGRKIADYLTPKLSSLWTAITDKLLPAFQRLWDEALAPIAEQLGTVFVGALGALVDYITNTGVPALVGLFDFLKDHEWVIWGVIGAFAVFKTAMAISEAVTAFQTSIAIMNGTFVGLKALIAAPMIMPALAIGAALISIGLVVEAIAAAQRAKDALGTQKEMQAKNFEAGVQLRGIAEKKYKSGAINKGEYDRLIGVSWLARGTNFAHGGATIVGEHGPELLDLPPGSRVTPAWQTRSQDGTAVSAGAPSVLVEQLHVHNEIDEQRFLKKLAWRLAA